MKKPVTQFDLAAAFKALDEIDYGKVESNPVKDSKKLNESLLKETCERISSRKLNIERLVEDYYDLDDEQDLNQAADSREAEIAQAKLARIEKIVDLDAQTADELLDSYVGKVIVRCPQCMNMFYKNEEDLVKDEEDPTICNINEPCQHCGNISGYEIIGKVDKLSPEDTAQLSGEEEAPEVEEETEEEVEATEEASEETTDEDLDLDLDLDLDDTTQESLNAAKAAKSDFASKNETENKTLNEDIYKDVKELDDKLKAHNDYIEYLKNEIVSANEALEKATNEEVKAAIQRKLDTLNNDLAAALPDAVKNDTTPDEVTADETVDIEENPIEELPTEEEVETKEEVTEESLNKAKAAKSDFESENNSEEAKSLHEGLTEDKRDDDDFYGKDIDDAVIQLKKTGHAEFWCRQGKAKADEVVKLFKDKYGKKAEYTIDDDYCTARVVKEDLHEDVASLLNAFEASLDDANFDAPVDESLDNEETFTNPVVVDLTEGGNVGKITVEAGDEALAKEVDKLASEKYAAEDQARAGSEYFDEIAAEKGLKYNPVFDESVNKAEADKNTAPENESENKSINECDGKTCQECDGAACEAKPEDNSEGTSINWNIDDPSTKAVQKFNPYEDAEDKLDEAVAITIGIDEVDDQVIAKGPTDTMIVAAPEATAVYDQPGYDQPEFPAVEIEPQEIENPFEQDFDTPADFVGEPSTFGDAPVAEPEAKVTAEPVEDEADEEDESDDDDSDDSDDNSNNDIPADAEESEDDDEDEDEDVEESLQEGIFDKIKGAASKVGGAVKNAFTSIDDRLAKGFEEFQVETKYENADPDSKNYTTFEQAKKAAIASSNLGNATQAKVLAKSKANGQITLIDGYIKGKQAGKGKTAYESALKAADGTAAINNTAENQAAQQEQAAKPDLENSTEGTVAQAAPAKEPTTDAATQEAPAAQEAKPAPAKNDKGAKARAQYRKVLKLLADAGMDISGLTNNGKVTDKLRNLAKGLTSTNESLTEDIESAADEAVAKLQQLADDAVADVKTPETPETTAPEATEAPAQEVPATPETPEATEDAPVEEGSVSAVGDVVNGVVDGAKELLADNADDKADAEAAPIADQVHASNHMGEEKPDDAKEESLEEDANGVSDAEFEQMINSKTFQDFSEEVNVEDIEDIDEESVNECTTNYLKEVYSNVDKFELTKADVTNGILVLEGLIKFHSGKTRNTTFGYNLATGKHLAFSGVNEDLAKDGQFNIQCSLNNKSLVVESLSYKHEVNGQLVEGLVHKN